MPKISNLHWVFLGTVILVVAGVAGWLMWLPREPIYRGRPISNFLTFPMRDESAAREALQNTKEEAIPFLLSMFDMHDSSLRARLARWSRQQTALKIRIRNPKTYEDRTWASRSLALLGTDAQSAVPRLAQLLRRPECATDAAYVLVHIGNPVALDALRSALLDPDVRVRRSVAWSLDAIAEHSRQRVVPLLPDLQRHFDDSDAAVRELVIQAVTRLQPAPNEVVVPLAQLLADPCPSVSRAAACALASFGKSAREALPALSNALAKADGVTRPALQRTFEMIGGSTNAP